MYYCHMCQTAEIDLKSLKIHITNEHRTMEPIKCEQCVETFIERYSQMNHFEKFHQQLYYQYYQKYADFFNQTDIFFNQKDVTNVHRGEKNVTNVHRGNEKSVPNVHRGEKSVLPNVHEGEETKREIYKCEYCHKCFGKQASLEKHVAYLHENFGSENFQKLVHNIAQNDNTNNQKNDIEIMHLGQNTVS